MIELDDLLAHVPLADDRKHSVVARLREPHRRYHNLDHVIEMWRWHRAHGKDRFDDTVVASFCLYHDAIYDPTARPGDNEKRSGDLWCEDSSEQEFGFRSDVLCLIIATEDHFSYRQEPVPASRRDIMRWCIDLDLLRLGSAFPVFEEHGRALAIEYGHLTERQWIKGSSEFRAKVMAQPTIYTHPEFPEQQARRNLSRALTQDWKALGYLDDSVFHG